MSGMDELLTGEEAVRLEIAERVEAWYDGKGDLGNPEEAATQFAADIGTLLSHVTRLEKRYQEARATRSALIKQLSGGAA